MHKSMKDRQQEKTKQKDKQPEDLEGACAPPLKFAKHMLYNINKAVQQTTFS
jgi:hypothetical protein